MQNNDDLINSILNDLDTKKEQPQPEPKQDIPAAAQPEQPVQRSSAPPLRQLRPVHERRLKPENQTGYQQPQPMNAPPYPQPDYPGQPENGGVPVRGMETAPPRKHKKKKKQRSRLPGVLILTTFIFAVSICLSMVIIAFGKDMLGIGKSDANKLINIPEGATTEQIATLLKDEGIIKSPKCFLLFSSLRKSDTAYIAGEHFIRPNMAYEEIIYELTNISTEQSVSVEVTFPEGLNIYEIADILEKNNVCNADEFVFYFNSGGFGFEFEDKLPSDTTLKLNRMEGYCFPDTYYFYENMEPEKVCQKIYYNFNSKMTEERYKKMEDMGLSLDQLVTLASIVQKEAPNADSMKMVASIFLNRLRNPAEFGGKLQSDPTTNYANDVVKPHLELYNKNMIDAYDTYIGTGLPPGAICNPGIEAIDAVLENFPTDYYYFAANIYTGVTLYAKTLDEHNENLAEIDRQYEEYYEASRAAELEAQNE